MNTNECGNMQTMSRYWACCENSFNSLILLLANGEMSIISSRFEPPTIYKPVTKIIKCLHRRLLIRSRRGSRIVEDN